MNAVWNSYGQLCGCPEIFKKSCKFFCRELDIRVSQIVNSDFLYSCFLHLVLHLVLYCFLHNGEESFILRHLIMTIYKILNLLFKKLRYFYQSYRLLRLRLRNHILPFCSIVSLGNADLISFKINILWCKCQQLSNSTPRPKEYFKDKIVSASRFHRLYELLVLIYCPEIQTSVIRTSHTLNFFTRICV